MTDTPRATGTVLVADDDAEVTATLQAQLGVIGYEVTVAHDGEEALAQLQARDFEVLLVDVRMPGISGLELMQRVRQAGIECEVIVVTAYADLELAIQCLRVGAFDLVQKPVRIPVLYASVARAAERRRVRAVSSLYAATQAVFAEPDPAKLPERIADMARNAMPADYVSLMLPDDTGQLYLAHSNGIAPELRARSTRVPLGERVVGKVASDGKPVIITDRLSEDPRFSGIRSLHAVQSSIVYPLKAGERLVGVLTFNRTGGGRRFGQSDLERAAILATQIVLALENTRLVRELVSSERLAAVGQLAGGIAHEINNPASYVVTNLGVLRDGLGMVDQLGQMLEGGAGRAELEQWWQSIGRAEGLADLRQALADASHGAERIAAIVRDVRTLARADDATMAPFDLNETVRSALRVAGADLRRRANVETQLGTEVEAVGSAGRVSQVLVNLLLVAIQAGEPEGRTEVRVVSRVDADRAVVEVTGAGPGIPADAVARLFDPTFTLDKRGRGTGLGLSVSRDLVRAQDGELSVSARDGGGLVFRLTLNAARE